MSSDNADNSIPFYKKNAWHTEWCKNNNDNDNKQQEKSFILYKSNDTILHVKKGDWVKIPGRDDKCIIDSINGVDRDNLPGPLGITYLPWRYNEQRFADVSWSMKGNRRFIICYPSGRIHFGGHIDWDKFELCEAPDNVNLDLVKEVLTNF